MEIFVPIFTKIRQRFGVHLDGGSGVHPILRSNGRRPANRRITSAGSEESHEDKNAELRCESRLLVDYGPGVMSPFHVACGKGSSCHRAHVVGRCDERPSPGRRRRRQRVRA
jgi:hypothetical protein